MNTNTTNTDKTTNTILYFYILAISVTILHNIQSLIQFRESKNAFKNKILTHKVINSK